MVADLLPYCRSLAQSPRRADRLLWLRIATDVIARADRADESLGLDWETQFSSNIDLIDEDVRLEIAKRLAKSGKSLARLSDAFLRRSDAAALWTLEFGVGLSESTLRQALPSTYLSTAIARRADLSEPLVEEILEANALPSLIELAANGRIRLSKLQLRGLIARAASAAAIDGDSRLSRALLLRAPLGVEYAPLFLEASSQQREQILFAVQRADLGGRGASTFGQIDELCIPRLERHALEGQSAAFISDLAETLACEPALAARIVRDISGEPLAVTLAALSAPNDVSVRILTACDMAAGSDYPRLSALARLQGALSASAAGTIVAAMLCEKTPSAVKVVAERRPIPPATHSANVVRPLRGQHMKREGQVGA